MIVVDPRFTRTAATADLFLQIRAGADIAFLGGLIKYAIDNNRIARDYLTQLTRTPPFSCRKASKLRRGRSFSGFDAASSAALYEPSPRWRLRARRPGFDQAYEPPHQLPTDDPRIRVVSSC